MAIRLLGRSVRRYIAVSDFIRREWIEAGIPAGRIDVVHNGVRPERYPMASAEERRLRRDQLGIGAESRVFLHYGRLTTEKGVLSLIHAWQQADLDDNWLLVLAGDLDADISRALAANTDLTIRVLPRTAEVSDLLDVADVTVLPALWEEPFGRVVIESMAAGVPVIASRRGGIPEILDGPWRRFLVEPNEPGSLLRAIKAVGDWRASEPELGLAASRLVTEQFNLNQTVDGVESILASVVGEHTTGGPLTFA